MLGLGLGFLTLTHFTSHYSCHAALPRLNRPFELECVALHIAMASYGSAVHEKLP